MYRYIGVGSAREVYDLDNGFVIKIARNIRGIAQNKAEFLISNDDNSFLLAKVYFISDDYRYLIMKKANNIKSERQYKKKRFNKSHAKTWFYNLYRK